MYILLVLYAGKDYPRVARDRTKAHPKLSQLCENLEVALDWGDQGLLGIEESFAKYAKKVERAIMSKWGLKDQTRGKRSSRKFWTDRQRVAAYSMAGLALEPREGKVVVLK